MSEENKVEEVVDNLKTRDGTDASPEAKEAVKSLISKPEPKPELTPEEKVKYEKQKEYFKILQSGAYFLKFVEDDLNKQRKQQNNRPERRRIEKSIKKGQINSDVINLYSTKIDEVLDYINERLNPSEKPFSEESQAPKKDN